MQQSGLTRRACSSSSSLPGHLAARSLCWTHWQAAGGCNHIGGCALS